MKFRVIKYQEYDAYMNMAIDHAISESVKQGIALPTLRFYGWKPKAISIGYFQVLNDEVDVNLCEEKGIDVVRRRTGGGAVFHDDEITYSIIGPESLFTKDITQSYQQLCGSIVTALNTLNIPATFRPINDIVVNGKKISGNAQTRREGILLQHGTILNSVDVDTMFTLLKVDLKKLNDKAIQDVKQYVTSIKDQNIFISKENIIQALTESFMKGYDFQYDTISEKEHKRALELKETLYTKDSFLRMR